MAHKPDTQPDVEIYLEQRKDPAAEPAAPPDKLQFPVVLGVPDKDMYRVYEASEANEDLNDQLLEKDEVTGEIVSQVKNVIPVGEFDPERPVMPKNADLNISMLERLIPEPEVQALKEAGAAGVTAARILGGSLEDTLHNSLKYFYSLTPDHFQESFKQTLFGQGAGIAGITGTEAEYEQTRLFPHIGGVLEEVARSLGQFAWGMKGVGIILNTKKALVLRGAISDMVSFNPEHGNLASMMREMDWGPEVLQDLAAYVDSTEPGTETEKRLRMAAEGIILTGFMAGAMKSPQAAREMKAWASTFFGEGGTGRPAIDAVAEMLREMKKKWPSGKSFSNYIKQHGWAGPIKDETGGIRVGSAVKKLSRTEETGSLNTIYPEVNQGMEETMSRMDPAEAKMLRENMEKHAGTPWAAATVRGMTIREFFHRAMEGRMDEALELANSALWGKDSLIFQGRNPDHPYKMGQAFMHSKDAVLAFARSYAFIGKNRKAELDISGSFKNCNPSPDCAKFCYAARANATPGELLKSEFTEWVAENHPDIIAERVGKTYNATAQGKKGLALRINDKGDLSEAQIELIKALNKKGHRIQIFSKRPDMLKMVPDFNLKMLSIDSTNFELARKHPEYQLAVTITDSMTPEMIAEVNERVAVYLPVNMKGGEVTRADVKKRFPKTFKKMGTKLCPVDGGKMITKPGTTFVQIASQTAERGVWTCPTCDKFGAAGCFYGKNQTENVKKITNQIKQANSPIPKSVKWIDTTGDAVVGDVVKFKEGVFGGSFRNPKFLGEREITGKIVKDSYGENKQQHTFSIEVHSATGYEADEVLTKAKKNKQGTIKRKARNVYREQTFRKQWDDESIRGKALDEKHERGGLARQRRETRRMDEGYYLK